MEKLDKNEIHNIFKNIKLGQNAAIEDFYKKYHKLVVSISFSIVKDNNIAEEISQSVFLKIMQISPDKLPSNNELSWIYTVTQNQTIDYLKKQHSTLDIDTLYDIPNSQNEINEIIDRDSYNKLISCLNDDEQEIVSLKILTNFTFKEIGLILNIPTATVQWKYYKSIHTLRILLSNLSLFIITTILYVVSKTNNDKYVTDNKNNIKQNDTHLNSSAIDGYSESNTSAAIQSNIFYQSKENILFGLSSIFLIITIIFVIIFSKHQQKRHSKSSK